MLKSNEEEKVNGGSTMSMNIDKGFEKKNIEGEQLMKNVLEALKTIKKYCSGIDDCNDCKIKNYCDPVIEGDILPHEWQFIEEEIKPKIRGFERVSYAPEDVKLPERSTKKSAGYDFFAPYDILVPAHGTSEIIKSGVKSYMRDNEVLFVPIRSSLGFKKDIILVNCIGIIDADFYNNSDNEGNISFKFRNSSDIDVIIKKGEKMAQGIFLPYLLADGDNATGVRTGGIGSTGK